MRKHLFLFLTLFLLGLADGQAQKKPSAPLIGISCSHPNHYSSVRRTYTESVLKAGGIPLLIPILEEEEALIRLVDLIDGIVLIGGGDIDPSYYGEEPVEEMGEIDDVRDVYDMTLIRLAAARNIPMLGICRGEQLINVAFGGSLYQDIPTQYPDTTVNHHQEEPSSEATHRVHLLPGSLFAEILGDTLICTNTHHHQAVKEVAPGFRATGWATDGIVEVIESAEERPIWGVQFHPEGHTYAGDTVMVKIFDFLIGKATTFHRAKEIHNRIFSIDSHTDTPLRFAEGLSLGSREKSQVNLPKMAEGRLDGQYLAAWVAQKGRDKKSTQQAVARVDELIDHIYREVELNREHCVVATTPEELAVWKKAGKKAFYIGMENAYGIGKDLSNISRFRDRGVTYITLCHTRNNDVCDSSSDPKEEWGGLSPYGKKVIREMNHLGIMVDLSHASEKTFYDVMALSKVPVIASHSSAAALLPHDRNLTDDQLRALAANGGVAQLCLVDEFLHTDPAAASLSDAIDHLEHMIRVAGIEHVGIGSDFDGGGGVKGCNGNNDLIQITVQLLERGYDEEDIAAIWGGNFLRVMKTVQDAAEE
ncbi:MAG: gamma-glutamyl-gamma-aminobutyrate hydrolase family protein [Bacteroides sp.]|nr:gamma-glutamyl-gamma-aminobutyrate hydrolase family protein [Bacteroides sp.]